MGCAPDFRVRGISHFRTLFASPRIGSGVCSLVEFPHGRWAGAPRMLSCDLADPAEGARSQERVRRRAPWRVCARGPGTVGPARQALGRADGTRTGVGWNQTGLVYDSDGMDCQGYREVLSACLDGEAGDDERAAAEDHLAGCASCRAFADGADRLGRLARVGPADPVPDLADRVLAALGVAAPAPAPPLPSVPRLSCLDGGCCSGSAGPAPMSAATSACGCASTCGCGCQQGAPCRCAVRAA
ncbi:hypothetical protein DMP17_36425 [Pseudonocardia sp. TMWB2A]